MMNEFYSNEELNISGTLLQLLNNAKLGFLNYDQILWVNEQITELYNTYLNLNFRKDNIYNTPKDSAYREKLENEIAKYPAKLSDYKKEIDFILESVTYKVEKDDLNIGLKNFDLGAAKLKFNNKEAESLTFSLEQRDTEESYVSWKVLPSNTTDSSLATTIQVTLNLYQDTVEVIITDIDYVSNEKGEASAEIPLNNFNKMTLEDFEGYINDLYENNMKYQDDITSEIER
jgi:hypothetical protein